MRLAQLARRIGKSQSEIVKFLADQNIVLVDGVNVRLADADVKQIIAHFAPELETQIVEASTERESLDEITEDLEAIASANVGDVANEGVFERSGQQLVGYQAY